jgi:hypothetical protein
MHCHVAHPATDIQHPHPRGNSGIPEKTVSKRRQYPSLTNQPELLGIRMTENVL